MGSTAVLERPSVHRTAEAIIRDGFAETDVDAGFLAQHVPNIRDGMRMMTDDESVHDIFAQQVPATDEMGWDQEAGLMRRDDEENKFVFQYHSPAVSWPFPDQECAKRFSPFLESCAALTEKARELAVQATRGIDASFPLATPLAPLVEKGRTVTRILRYFPLKGVRTGNADAYAHIDRSYMTIHWWASEEGLVLFDTNRVGHRVAEKAWDRIAIFPGKKYFGMTDGSRGMQGVHGVRDSRVERTEDRIAMVTFVHLPLTPEAVSCIARNRQAFKEAEKLCEL